jgi:hypothetical protein
MEQNKTKGIYTTCTSCGKLTDIYWSDPYKLISNYGLTNNCDWLCKDCFVIKDIIE